MCTCCLMGVPIFTRNQESQVIHSRGLPGKGVGETSRPASSTAGLEEYCTMVIWPCFGPQELAPAP